MIPYLTIAPLERVLGLFLQTTWESTAEPWGPRTRNRIPCVFRNKRPVGLLCLALSITRQKAQHHPARGNFALNCVIIFLRPPHSFLTVINQLPTIKTHLKAGETVRQFGALVAFAKNPRFSSQKLHGGSKSPITAGQTLLLSSSGSRHPLSTWT